MRREQPVINSFLQRMERQRHYQRHLNWIHKISTGHGAIDISRPPPVRRLERSQKVQANERLLQFKYDQMNLHSLKLVEMKQRKTRAFTSQRRTPVDGRRSDGSQHSPQRTNSRMSGRPDTTENLHVISYQGTNAIED